MFGIWRCGTRWRMEGLSSMCECVCVRARVLRDLAVRGHEDDRLGCHSWTLFLIGCDVPRWTSAQPGSLASSPACPLGCRHKLHNILFWGEGHGAFGMARLPRCHLAAVPVSSGPRQRERHRLFVCFFFCKKKKRRTNHSKTLMFSANVTVRPQPAELMSAF